MPAQPPTPVEIDAILMTVDALVGQAGRTGVVQVLNGSRSQKVQQRGWDQLPEYGAFSGRTAINQTLTAFGLPALRQRGHSGSHSASNTRSNG